MAVGGRPLNKSLAGTESMHRAILMAFLLGLAFVLGQTLIYERLIVPRLSAWHEIPWGWWLAAVSPALSMIVAASWMIRRVGEATVFCVSGALFVTALQWLAGAMSAPGTGKLIEGGPMHFAFQFLVMTVIVSVAVGAFSIVRIIVRRTVGAS